MGERRICGATTRAGTPCQRPPLAGRTRCRLHGGATPVGIASPHFRTGRYSRYLPDRLAARYEEARRDPELLNLTDELAAVDALLGELLGQLDRGESGAAWSALQAKWAELARAKALGRAGEAAVALEEIGAVIERGALQLAAYVEIGRLLEQRRKLTEAEVRRRVVMRFLIHVEQVESLLVAVQEVIRHHVHDRQALAAIAAELRALAAREPAGE